MRTGRPPEDPVVRFHRSYEIDTETGCWLWTKALNRSGYPQFFNGKKSVTGHRFALGLRVGVVPSYLCALHRCDTPRCVNPDHLFLGTPADNNADMVAKGRQSRGEGARHLETRVWGVGHPGAKLSEEDVWKIRDSFTQLKSVLAAQFDVSTENIHAIVSGRTWQRLKEQVRK